MWNYPDVDRGGSGLSTLQTLLSHQDGDLGERRGKIVLVSECCQVSGLESWLCRGGRVGVYQRSSDRGLCVGVVVE